MRLLLSLLAVVVMLAPPAFAQATPEATLRAWSEAYATNEGPRAAAVYAPDAVLWGSVSRQLTVGRDAITAYFGRVRPGLAGIAVEFGEYQMQPLGEGVAVAAGHYTFIQRRADGTENREPSRFSMVLARGADGVWRIANHHSSRLPPAR
ncbi:MAG: SgcJ/EcaC family oxidoreductase [Pseudomonadota bacterium]